MLGAGDGPYPMPTFCGFLCRSFQLNSRIIWSMIHDHGYTRDGTLSEAQRVYACMRANLKLLRLSPDNKNRTIADYVVPFFALPGTGIHLHEQIP